MSTIPSGSTDNTPTPRLEPALVDAARAELDSRMAVFSGFLATAPAQIATLVSVVEGALKRRGTVYVCGNGGSASQAEHIAAEFVGRFAMDRPGLPAHALTTDSAIMTAVSNDYGFESVFERQVEALVREGDLLIALSTSGRSENVLRAIAAARTRGAVTVGLTGATGDQLCTAADHCIKVASTTAAKIQEIHLITLHIVCGLVEQRLFGAGGLKAALSHQTTTSDPRAS